MAIHVYGASYSTRTQRVLVVLEKLGLSYQLHNVDMSKGEHCSPEFKVSHHPFGKLPAIDDSGFKLFESRAIVRYLLTRYPGVLKVPTDPTTLGKIEQEASVEYAYLEPAVSGLGFEKIFKKMFTGQDADEQTVARLEGELNKVLDYYADVLEAREWLAGPELSLIDLSVIPTFHFLVGRLGYVELINSRPKLSAWWDKASQDEAWQKVIRVH